MNERFLKRLMETASPSGFEQPFQRVWKEEAKNFSDQIEADVNGNAIATINPDKEIRVMLVGHCDEIGCLVKYINEKGFIYFAQIGGIDPLILVGQRVKIHTSKEVVLGVVGRRPIHLLRKEEEKKIPEISDLWIDIGVKNRKEAKKLVSIGDPITVAAGYQEIQKNLVISRGFDDRIGAFIVAETLRLLFQLKSQLKVAVYGVSSVQEEIGSRGARTSTFAIDPHIGIAIDVTCATDHPDIEKKRVGEVALGKGPVITRGANINPTIFSKFSEIGRENKIPYQVNASPGATGTDANVIQISRKGVTTGLISIPLRYMHTPVEMISLNDVRNTINLLKEFILSVQGLDEFIPR